MNAIKFQELLESKRACEEATEWAKGKTWQEVFETCHRGDWLLWLFKKTNPEKLRELTLAKAHSANTVRHLMKDARSTNAIDVAIKFGEGNATREDLNVVAAAAYAYAAAAAAGKQNQQQTADICRKYLPIEIWGLN